MLFQRNEQKGKYVFRLTAVFFLVFLLNPGQYIKQREAAAEEHGIGGGYVSEEVVSESEDGVIMTPASFEAAEEPESFTKPVMLLYGSHIVEADENIIGLAVEYGLNQDTIISINKIRNTRLLQIGSVLKIPNQDGILHTVKSGETIDSIAESYKADAGEIQTVNEIFSANIVAGTDIFIPGAKLDFSKLQEINGDLFIRPVPGAITSYYGYRRSPFNRNIRQFHNGIDLRGSTGTPVRAAMAGRVSAVGFDRVLGNYIMINHHSGYRTAYGHLSVIRTRTGAYVAQGERIGDVGNTGQSTGPHLHFIVKKNGVTINPLALMR
jgi:murein DD-endopeptidase MepM/ murein hydrolase activator NlpD